MKDKKKLLFIPGTLCTEELFTHQIQSFEKKYTIQVADISLSDSLEDLVQNTLNIITGSFIPIGLSYGGIICFEILRQANNRVEKLVLIDTTYKEPSQKTKENLTLYQTMIAEGGFKNVVSNHLKTAMIYPYHDEKKIENIKKKVFQMAMNTGVENYFKQIKSQLSRPDYSDDLEKISCPTLIISGKQDKVCPEEIHKTMNKKIQHSHFESIDECGHLSTLEQPQKVTEIIRQWL